MMPLSTIKKIVFALLGALAVIIFIKEVQGNGDFKVFLEASKLIAEGENPYGEWIFVSEGNYAKYYYSPLWAVLLFPFLSLSNILPNAIWLLLNYFFLYRIFSLLRNKLFDFNLSEKQSFLISLFSTLLSIRFILYNLDMLQMTPFIIWGVLESNRLAKEKQNILAGVLLAFIINIKIIPIVILPYWIYRKQVIPSLVAVVSFILFLILPATLIGMEFNSELLKSWWHTMNPSNVEHLIEDEFGAHSLTALCTTLFMETESIFQYKRNIVELSLNHIQLIINSIRAILILTVLALLKPKSLFKSRKGVIELKELSYLLLLIPLIFPRQQKYAFLLALPAQYYVVSFLVLQYRRVKNTFQWKLVLVLVCCSFLLMTATSDLLLGRNLSKITQHYKLITYGALALLATFPFISFEKNTKLS